MKKLRIMALCLVSLMPGFSFAENSGYLDCYRSVPPIGDNYGDLRTGFASISMANDLVNQYSGSLRFKNDANMMPVRTNENFLFINVTFEKALDGSFFIENQNSTVLHKFLQFDTRNEAVDFCNALVSMCMNTHYSAKSGKTGVYGNEGGFIGVRQNEWRPHYWGLSVQYKVGSDVSSNDTPTNDDDDDRDDDNSGARLKPATTVTSRYEALRCLTSQ